MCVALGQGSFSALEADSFGSLTSFAGFLSLIPWFITDVLGSSRRGLGTVLRRATGAERGDSVADPAPEQWHRVPDPELPGPRDNEGERH